MKRIELENMSILELRKLAEKNKIKSTKKHAIIAALADDYRGGSAAPIATPTQPQAPQSATQQEPQESIVWSEVPVATSEVNGDYIIPPWYEELQAASAIGHVELMGSAGSGKTLAVHHLAVKNKKKLAVITADGGLRKRDLIGTRELINASSIHMAAEFATAARDGDWALIDEANMAEADALGFLNGVLDRPGIEGSTFTINGKVVPVSPDFRCFITRNPGYQGTKIMNEALRDRFWTIEVPPLLDDALRAMFEAHGMNKEWSCYCAYTVETLYKSWERQQTDYQISPRRALSAYKMARKMKVGQVQALILEKSILTKIEQRGAKEAVELILDSIRTARRSHNPKECDYCSGK